MNNNTKRFVYTLLLLIALYIFYKVTPGLESTITSQIDLLQNKKELEIAEYISGFGSYKVFVSLYFMVLQAVVANIMATNVVFANAQVYGWFAGGFLSWVGGMFGTIISFFIARNLLHSIVYRYLSLKYLKIMDDYLDKFGGWTILMIKLSHFLYFDLITYLAGASSMRFSSFLKAVTLGQLINVGLMSYTGAINKNSSNNLFGIVMEYVLPLCILIFIVYSLVKNKKSKES